MSLNRMMVPKSIPLFRIRHHENDVNATVQINGTEIRNDDKDSLDIVFILFTEMLYIQDH